MAVDHVDRNNDRGALAELNAVKRGGGDRSAHQDRCRRIEPHRLLEHCIEELELADVVTADITAGIDAAHFLPYALLPFRKQREQVKTPGQGLRGRFMTRHQESYDIIDDEPRRHGIAGCRISRAYEPAQEVISVVLAVPLG